MHILMRTSQDQRCLRARDANVTHTHAHTCTHTHTRPHTFICITSSFMSLAFCFCYFCLPPFCVYAFDLCARVCVARPRMCLCVGLSCGDSRLHWPPSPCLASPIFDSSKGCVRHNIIGMLSDFLFVMITQNNKSEITFFVQSKAGDRQGLALCRTH